MNLPPKLRTYTYLGAVILIAVLGVLGIINIGAAREWLLWVTAALGFTSAAVATAHAPTKVTK